MPNDITLIRDFVRMKVNEQKLDDTEDILGNGYASSMFAVQALAWVEKTFDLTILSGDLMIDNFRSIQAIAEFVDRKKAEAAVA